MILESFTTGLPGKPAWQPFRYRDVNPLGGTTKVRLLGAPNPAMRLLHHRLVRFLRGLNVPMPHAVGARPAGSPVVNVRRHLYIDNRGRPARYRPNRYFLLYDLRHAYCNVDPGLLAGIICQHCPELTVQDGAVLDFLLGYCFGPNPNKPYQLELPIGQRRRGGLVQGGPASPDLFNLYVAITLDQPLGELCQRYGLTYSRYLDDLTFSSRERSIGTKKRQVIRRKIRDAGFTVSDRKAKNLDIRKGPLTINGVCLNRQGTIFCPRRYLRRIRTLVHAARKGAAVDLAALHGMMGVFTATLPRRWELVDINGRRSERRVPVGRLRIEQKTLDEYRQLQARQRRQP